MTVPSGRPVAAEISEWRLAKEKRHPDQGHLLDGQLGQRRADDLFAIFAFDQLIRRGRCGGQEQRFVRIQRAVTLAAGNVNAPVAGNAEQPSRKRGLSGS